MLDQLGDYVASTGILHFTGYETMRLACIISMCHCCHTWAGSYWLAYTIICLETC